MIKTIKKSVDLLEDGYRDITLTFIFERLEISIYSSAFDKMDPNDWHKLLITDGFALNLSDYDKQDCEEYIYITNKNGQIHFKTTGTSTSTCYIVDIDDCRDEILKLPEWFNNL